MPARAHVLYAIHTNNLWHLIKECIWEWVAVVLLALAAALLELVQPFQRVAFASDISIAYPHKNETVPSWLLAVLAVGVPVVFILVISLLFKRSVFDAHMSLLGLCVALAFTLLFTQVVKITTGGLRPDFLSRCKPVLVENDPLRMVAYCTGDEKEVKEGRKSFFSGHSSLSWAGLGFLALYLSRHLNFKRAPLAPKYIITILPIILAFLISISRVDDYWHRWQDVFVGGIVGAIVATYNYRYHCAIIEDVVQPHQRGAAETDRLATGVSRGHNFDGVGGGAISNGEHMQGATKDGTGEYAIPMGQESLRNDEERTPSVSTERLNRNEETWIPMGGSRQ
ncbi:uncharacterized protein SPPG_07006 [Spizellomyces punctatus DAOM BR117]|uniref:Phosphatidic acid phosphatase type 2/haloperoxidase domain-containing protein n=1 Tax=Spizellomyces punctatus (strain DAOM BR117) TaxID=645134 RepID=A0A0L0H953_SPIPD|nr:uncharacterized protein SPPG_07006 [Spizellomyces punctatus DAOM BR117]KNC97531.1 hypothetical protein SPPG_07006 [Spizellomyces punctatus DAOM BR117]|eukprot:XP_016605571.1 hypothetical protein SPPG_07006 [Spizellomyces punctatus DAOM BR117]